jgi:hypothetical protein
MAAPLLSNMLLTEEELAILKRADASFSGKIEKCFNLSFSSSERERCQRHFAANPHFVPCSPDLIIAPDFHCKESELNRTKGRLDVLDMRAWSQAVSRYKLTGGITSDVRRCAVGSAFAGLRCYCQCFFAAVASVS